MASKQKPHAFLLPYPVQGHIAPMMHLSKQLVAKGFVVTFLNTEHNHFRLVQSQAQGRKLSTEDAAPDIRLLWLPNAVQQDNPSSGNNVVDQCHDESRQAFVKTVQPFMKMERDVEDLVASLMLQDPPVTCMISDLLAAFSQDIANRLGIPRVAFVTSSAATHASILMASRGFRFLTEPPASNVESNVITCIPGAPPLKIDEVNPVLVPGGTSDFMFDFFTRSIERGVEAASILMNTFDELEHATLEYLRKQHRVYTVGPLLPPSFFTSSLDIDDGAAAVLWPEDYGCLQWLDNQLPASVLYVSFGSLTLLSPLQLEELALGLEASQQPVLWVSRLDQMHGKSLEAFLHRMKDRVAMVSWAPQLHVLSHPSVGGFLTHCGWNSTLESISAGVPMLGWPIYGDQMTNCRFVVDSWKAGLCLEADESGCRRRGEVEKKVRELMQGERGREVRKRARDWRGAAVRGMQQGGSSWHNMELLMQELDELSTNKR